VYTKDIDRKLEQALEDSFPGSDPISISQPKPNREPVSANSAFRRVVQSNPVVALAAAAIVGMVLGLRLRARLEGT
jgi:hypothetical protein